MTLKSEDTGERIYPVCFSQAFKDHRNRYYWALEYINEGGLILDLACGVGYGSAFLANNSPCKNVVGVDISKNALDWARKYFNSEKVSYFNLDVTKDLSKADIPRSFDLITCFETIEHIEEDSRFLKVLYNLLSEEGTLLISSPCEEVIPHENNPFFENGKNPFHFKHYLYQEFVELLESAGFFVTEEYTQYEEIIKGRGLAVNLLVCRKRNIPKVQLNQLDLIIQSCYKLKFNNAKINLPDFNIIDVKFSEIIDNYLMLEEVSIQISNGEYDKSFEILGLIDEHFNPEKYFFLGLIFVGKGNYLEAFSHFSKLISINKNINPIFVKLAKDHIRDLIEYL